MGSNMIFSEFEISMGDVLTQLEDYALLMDSLPPRHWRMIIFVPACGGTVGLVHNFLMRGVAEPINIAEQTRAGVEFDLSRPEQKQRGLACYKAVEISVKEPAVQLIYTSMK